MTMTNANDGAGEIQAFVAMKRCHWQQHRAGLDIAHKRGWILLIESFIRDLDQIAAKLAAPPQPADEARGKPMRVSPFSSAQRDRIDQALREGPAASRHPLLAPDVRRAADAALRAIKVKHFGGSLFDEQVDLLAQHMQQLVEPVQREMAGLRGKVEALPRYRSSIRGMPFNPSGAWLKRDDVLALLAPDASHADGTRGEKEGQNG